MPETPKYNEDPKRENWKRFLESASNVSRAVSAPLLMLGAAAFAGAVLASTMVPMALAVGILATGAASVVTAVTSNRMLEDMRYEDIQKHSHAVHKSESKAPQQEIHYDGLTQLAQKESGVIKPENIPETEHETKKEWRQRIQTAELNEAAQRSIH